MRTKTTKRQGELFSQVQNKGTWKTWPSPTPQRLTQGQHRKVVHQETWQDERLRAHLSFFPAAYVWEDPSPCQLPSSRPCSAMSYLCNPRQNMKWDGERNSYHLVMEFFSSPKWLWQGRIGARFPPHFLPMAITHSQNPCEPGWQLQPDCPGRTTLSGNLSWNVCWVAGR